MSRLVLLALTLWALGVPMTSAQAPLPFDGVPWVGYNAGASAFPGNPNPTERDPYAIASADFDADGDMDVAVANYDYAAPGGTDGSSGFALLFNQGDGTYGEAVHYTFTTKGSFDIVTGDFDEDGYPDLALPNSGRITSEAGNTVVLFLNDGSGDFTQAGSFLVAERPLSLAAGDFDGDGHLDLVADSYRFDSRNVAVLFGTGTGSFAPRVLVPVVNIPDGVAAADLDADGYDDIMVSVLGDLYVVMGDGDRTFATPVMVSETGSQPIVGRIAAADLDGDGALDLVHGVYQGSGTYVEKDVAVRLGHGDGTFAAPVYYDTRPNSTTPEAIVPVDLDGDGDLDVATCDWTGGVGDGITLLYNDGTGTLGSARHVPAGQGTQDVVAADIDADGDADLISADRMSLAVTVHRNPGDGAFPVLTPRPTTTSINVRLDAGDVDGDGDLDVFTSGEAFGTPGALLKNNGDGTFAAPLTYTHSTAYGRGASNAKLRDLDGDGDLDLLYNDAHTDDTNGYDYHTALNDGTGTFEPLVEWDLNTCGNGDIDAFDLDNDGDLDVVNLEELNCIGQNNGRRIFVSLNAGDATFQNLPPFAISQAPRRLAGGDVNEDGVVDLVTTHWDPYGFQTVVNVHLGNGDGTFQEERVYSVGKGPMDVVLADLDSDGHLDIATANSGSDDLPTNQETMSVLYGTGTGTFSVATTYYAPFSPDLLGTTGIAAGDVDGDGDLDLMVTTVANGVAMYYNDGPRSFTFAHRLGITWNPWDPFFADFTGDGLPDLMAVVALPPSGTPSALALLPGLQGQTAPVAVAAQPVGGPITLPAQGGSFQFTVTLTNMSAQTQTFQAWSAATGPVSRSPLIGPQTVTLPPGRTVTRTLTQSVPGAAPAGTYTYTVNVGTFGGAVSASDSFPLSKQGNALATRTVASRAGWRAEGWESGVSASVEGARGTAPEPFALSQNHPNPFDRATTIRYSVPAASHVRLSVYDALGREVAVLADSRHPAGEHEVVFEALTLPSGVYLYRLEADGYAKVGRMMLFK